MRPIVLALALVAGASSLLAQRPDSAAKADSAVRARRDLKAVTIVAAPVDRLRPAGIVHVNALQLGAAPSANTWELLRQTAGLEVHEQGQGPGFASDASLRGFSSDHSTDLALWIDGVPVNEPVNGHAEGYNDWSLLFKSAVQDMDVIEGPTSALFGNFALAGVVNVRTIDRFAGTQLTVNGGSYGRGAGTVLTGFDHGSRGGGVLGLHYEREDGFRPNAGYDIVQGHARYVHELSPDVAVDLGSELYASNWSSAGFLSEGEFTSGQYDIVSNPSDGGLKRRAQERASIRVLKGSMLWRTTAYATEGQWRLFLTIPPAGGRFEGSGSQTEEEDRRYGLGLTSAATWMGAGSEFTLGGELRYDHSRYENFFTTDRQRDSTQAAFRASQGMGAIFVQSHYDLTDRLRLDLGARADAFSTRTMPDGEPEATGSTAVFSPKLGARFTLTDDVSWYANVSRGFRSTDGIVADPTLPVITAWSYESGLKFTSGDRFLTATLFRMNVSNEQTFNDLTGESSSGGSSRRQGLEVQWGAPITDGLRTTGSWTFNDARYTHLTVVSEDDNAPPQAVDGLRVYNTAQYVGSASLDLAPQSVTWRAHLTGNWVGPYSPFDEPGQVFGAYGLLHASVAFPLAGIDVNIGVRNLLDRAYPEVIAGHLYAPGQPRSVYVSMQYTIK
jgi:outer membrane receptor protein involved in Fe transport